MIPRIQTGDRFKGAALYYLHDKRLEGEDERLTTERVAWSQAVNTLENDPYAVIREMQHTAMSQQRLRYQSGKRTDGRPTERTVMTVALAWSPDQSPDREQMLEAGQSFLKHMGWQDHQVLFVAHNDTKHPHVHLIINRIHPETGMTMDSNWSKTRAQKWALAYEREHGHIYCHAREARYSRDQEREHSHMNRREWLMWQEISKDGALDREFHDALRSGEWDALKGGQKDERLTFLKETWQMRNQLRTALRDEVRAEFAPQWQAYAREKEGRDRKAALYDRETRRAIRELRKQQGRTPRPVRGSRPGNTSAERRADGSTYVSEVSARPNEIGVTKGPDGRTHITRRRVESAGIEQLKERRKAYHARQREEQWEMRSGIMAKQKERLGVMMDAALPKLNTDRAREYGGLLATHRGARAELRQDQREGERRHDVLPGQQADPLRKLTVEQVAAYVAHAREFAKADTAQFEKTRRETTDRNPTSGQAQQAAKEVTDRGQEKKDKDQAQEGKRQSDVEWYLNKRAADRARERDGGRDR